MNKNFSHLKIDVKSSILNALSKMDDEKVKSLLVFEQAKFMGLLTIGDIQRAIIRRVDLNEIVELIFDRNKLFANESDSVESIKTKMLRLRAECMPVLSNNGDLINIYFWSELFDIKQTQSRDKINLPVVIMAGGMGTRLKPITNIIPKPLIPLDEKTILEKIMDQFIEIGCDNFYLSVNYKYELIDYYLKGLDTKYNVEFFKENQPLGTIGSVSLLKNKLTKPFFVSNCDILIDQDYRDVYDYHIENNNVITIVTAVKTYNIPYGVVETGADGELIDLHEKPNKTYMINTGVYLLNHELIDEIPENTFFHITHLIEKIMKNGSKVGCFPVSEKSWTDIGDWNEYLKIINK